MSILDKYRSIRLQPVEDVSEAPKVVRTVAPDNARSTTINCPICERMGGRGKIIKSVCVSCDEAMFPNWLFEHSYDAEVKLRATKSAAR